MAHDWNDMTQEERLAFGVDAVVPEQKKLDAFNVVGRVFGGILLAIFLGSVLAMLAMFAAWWLMWLYGALF